MDEKLYALGIELNNEIVGRSPAPLVPIVTSAKKPKKKSITQKSAIAAPIAKELVNTMLLASGMHFDKMCQNAMKLIKWKEGKRVKVSELSGHLSEESEQSSSNEEADSSLRDNDLSFHPRCTPKINRL